MNRTGFKVTAIILLCGILCGSFILMYYFNFSQMAIEKKIYGGRGYKISKQTQDISISVEIEPNWLPEKKGEELNLDLLLYDEYNTKIVLEKIFQPIDDNRMFMQFRLFQSFNRKSGEFVSQFVIPEPGVFSGIIFEPKYFDKKGNPIYINDGHYFTKNHVGVWFDGTEIRNITEPIILEYTGFNLIEYQSK